MKIGYALITGASGGIGCELAKEFARHGHNLILVARHGRGLEELAERIADETGVRVHVLVTDLAVPGAAEELYHEVRRLSLDVDILVNNAGAGQVGLFVETPMETDGMMIRLNIAALTELTKLFGRDMAARGQGKILNVASTGSYHPGPYTAVYYATKAYVLSFTEAIARELSPLNVTVTALCPGATRTGFAERAGKSDPEGAMDAETVARIAYKGFMKGKRVIVPGFLNKCWVKLPRQLAGAFVGRYQEKLMKKRDS